MYTEPAYLSIKNVQELCAIISILAEANTLVEKKKAISGLPLNMQASSPRFGTCARKFLMKNLKISFTSINIEYDASLKIIMATITPK